MIAGPLRADRGQDPFFSLVPFLLVAFGLAWGILALFIFLPNQMTALFDALTGQHPLFFFGGAAVKGNLFAEPFPFSSFQTLVVALLFMVIKGPVEEFGWRGLINPIRPDAQPYDTLFL